MMRTELTANATSKSNRNGNRNTPTSIPMLFSSFGFVDAS
jgi:hypothetical protein